VIPSPVGGESGYSSAGNTGSSAGNTGSSAGNTGSSAGNTGSSAGNTGSSAGTLAHRRGNTAHRRGTRAHRGGEHGSSAGTPPGAARSRVPRHVPAASHADHDPGGHQGQVQAGRAQRSTNRCRCAGASTGGAGHQRAERDVNDHQVRRTSRWARDVRTVMAVARAAHSKAKPTPARRTPPRRPRRPARRGGPGPPGRGAEQLAAVMDCPSGRARSRAWAPARPAPLECLTSRCHSCVITTTFGDQG